MHARLNVLGMRSFKRLIGVIFFKYLQSYGLFMQISRWESLKQQSDQLRKAERETLVTL